MCVYHGHRRIDNLNQTGIVAQSQCILISEDKTEQNKNQK